MNRLAREKMIHVFQVAISSGCGFMMEDLPGTAFSEDSFWQYMESLLLCKRQISEESMLCMEVYLS
jgi:hypothetical protein